MIKSKYVKTLSAMLLTVGVITGYTGINAYAKNNEDTEWAFEVFGKQGTSYTDARTKEDKSKVYCQVKEYNTSDDDDYLQMYVVDSNKKKFSKTFVKTVTGEGQYSISSMAYEDRGQTRVRLAFYAPYRYTYTWNASGVWSPDSSGDYK